MQAMTASDHQPSGDELPCRQSEQVKADGLAEDGIEPGCNRARGVPEEGERGPVGHHGHAADESDAQRENDAEDPQHPAQRQAKTLLSNEDSAVLGQIRFVSAPEDEKPAIENEKREDKRNCEDTPLQPTLFQKTSR